jgi:flagellar assembly protein FliH
MATIIKASDARYDPPLTALNFDDLAAQAGRHLAEARAGAAQLVAEARGEADAIRRQAAEAGLRAAAQQIETRLEPALAALQQAAAELRRARQAWLLHWESRAVHLAAAIAARIVRGEIDRRPEIALTLVREALELAAGSPNVRLRLAPEDLKTLGTQVRTLSDAIAGLGSVEVTSDAAIGRGGCRVETRFGSIDQQIESQLKRIEEELNE